MRDVRHPRQDARSPHKPAPDGQPLGQLDLPLPEMPYATSRGRQIPLRAEADVVLSVDECLVGAGGVEVYDIQVEEDHNFFANGVCVHNCLIIDDVIKSNEEARSKTYRDRAWDWFTKVALTRRMGRKLVIITFTRWHEDDIIGRLTDPNNEHYSHKLAKKIKIIDLPAVAGPDDPLGRKEGAALWPDGPDKFDLDFLEDLRAVDPLGFEALYQQRPSVADGVLFRREHIRYYDPADLPDGLRIYCASDHAVTTNQRSDSTVLLKVGVDKQNNIYLLDCWWRKARTPEVVEAMLEMARSGEAPLVWWAERGHITQSIGPFLRKRMAETSTFINIVDVTPVNDKEQRAQSISARMAMGYVHFPKDKPWVGPAVEQLMAFPNGKHDDFVDTLAWVGLGLRNMVPGSPARHGNKPPRFGTLNWVKEAQRQDEMRLNLASTGGF
jgi:predicted phage terminase large subunit-like protein